MIKIRKVEYIGHPILGDFKVDFTDLNNKSVDTIIIAGENGVGKSTLLNSLYSLCSNSMPISNIEKYEFEINGVIYNYEKTKLDDTSFRHNWIPSNDEFQRNLGMFKGIYSKVDINFNSHQISAVTSKNIDQHNNSIESNENLPNEINQLIIDLQTLDDSELASAYRNALQNNSSLENLTTDTRMKRFKQAFSNIFSEMKYSGIENINNAKEIIFTKYGKKIPITKLSSGEKQIVYRGAFLLKDCNSLSGAFVFIDEPEISLHPEWQKRILNYYCDIFRNSEGQQTSQIFFVTHSPFIIHNENRKNDKVIILSRNPASGKIEVKDKPEYYSWSNPTIIKEAFNIKDFNPDKGSVFLEGRTDEKYFKKAIEVFNYVNLPFDFKWIGYIDNTRNERNTGKDALIKAFEFLVAQNTGTKYVCLADCDTNRRDIEKNNVYQRTIKSYENTKKMKIGIENALILDSVDVTHFYKKRENEGDYGEKKIIEEFDKMEFCDYICSLPKEQLKTIFANIKLEIDKIKEIFS